MPRSDNDMPVFLHAGHVKPQRHWHIGEHVHPDHHEIIVVLSGSIEVTFPDETAIADAGEVLFYRKRRVHAEKAMGNIPLETVFLGFAEGGFDCASWGCKVADRSGRMAMLARWLLEQSTWPSGRQGPPAAHLLTSLLHEYACCGQDTQSDVMRNALAYIHEHLSEPIYLENLADLAAMSKYHFARKFRDETGLSPMAYVRRARVQAAQTLLANSPLPLRRIAPMVGFRDEFQLCRVYKQTTGKSPRHKTRRNP